MKAEILLRLVMLEENSKIRLSPKSIQPSGKFSLTINSYYTSPSGACVKNVTPMLYLQCARVFEVAVCACGGSWVLICAGVRVSRAALATWPAQTPRHQDCASGPSRKQIWQMFGKIALVNNLELNLSNTKQNNRHIFLHFFFENMTHRA